MSMQTLVMVPGLGSDAVVWNPTIAALAGDLRCVVADTLSDTSLVGMARRLLDTAPERFALAGVSMGGMVAMEVMKLAPDRVTRLVLVDTMARPDTFLQWSIRHISNYYVRFSGDFRRLSEQSLGMLVHPSASAEIRHELVEMGARVGVEAFVRQNRAVIARRDQRPVLPKISIPCLVIVGLEDRMTPLALSKEIHELTPGSVLQVISDCGHLPPIEKPEVTAALLRDFILGG